MTLCFGQWAIDKLVKSGMVVAAKLGKSREAAKYFCEKDRQKVFFGLGGGALTPGGVPERCFLSGTRQHKKKSGLGLVRIFF